MTRNPERESGVTVESGGTEFVRGAHMSGVSGFTDGTEVERVDGRGSGMPTDIMSESELVRVDHMTESDNMANETAEFGKIEDDNLPNLEKDRASSIKDKK